jgi:hypothetical protein
MTDELEHCVICHEAIQPYHQVAEPKRCPHKFHVLCINIWLTHHRSCPLCRRRISIESQVPWRTLFAVALTINQEQVLERAAYTYAFLTLALRRYDTAHRWNRARDALIAIAEHVQFGITRLPFLDLSRRTTAIQEKKKWRTHYIQMTGEEPRRAERIASACRWIAEGHAIIQPDYT